MVWQGASDQTAKVIAQTLKKKKALRLKNQLAQSRQDTVTLTCIIQMLSSTYNLYLIYIHIYIHKNRLGKPWYGVMDHSPFSFSPQTCKACKAGKKEKRPKKKSQCSLARSLDEPFACPRHAVLFESVLTFFFEVRGSGYIHACHIRPV